MQELTPTDQQEILNLLQQKIVTLPDELKDPEALKFFDMLARSEELGLNKEKLRTAIENDAEPFMIVFHIGAVKISPKNYVAFQVEAYKRHWVLRVGQHDPTGKDFLIPYNSVTVVYADQPNSTNESLAALFDDTLRAVLSGKLQVFISSGSNNTVYASELVWRDMPAYAIDTAWFGEKTIAQPARIELLQNKLLPYTASQESHIFAKQESGQFKGRIFADDNPTPLTEVEFEQFNGRLVTNPANKLSSLSAGFMLLGVATIIGRQTKGTAQVVALSAAVCALVILLTLVVWWFPQIMVTFLIAEVLPFLSGAAVLGLFIGAGTLLYHVIPGLASIVDGENIALSMIIVLGWGIIGLVLGGIVYLKTKKKLVHR